MKKLLLVLLTVAMLLTMLAGCGNTEIPPVATPEATPETDPNILTFQQAKEVAKKYWELSADTEVGEDGKTYVISGFEDDFVTSNDIKYYRFDLKWSVHNENGEINNYSIIDTVYVNTVTSECTYDKP